MESTPGTVKILSGALRTHEWEQNDLAQKSGINRATVSMHLSGLRPIRDDHLALYIAVLDKTEQSMLVSAWLRDCLPESAALNVLEPQSSTIREEVRQWKPGLTDEQKHMLDWWAEKLAADDELDHIFKAISRKAGWQS